jgi:hypothetical protein
MPPLLMKILMEVDTKDPLQVLKGACKALSNYDEKQPEIVTPNLEPQDTPPLQQKQQQSQTTNIKMQHTWREDMLAQGDSLAVVGWLVKHYYHVQW